MPGSKIFLNGEFVPREEARVSVFDHGFLYGDGCFEGIRAYDGRVFRLDQHLRRFYDSAKALNIEVPYTPDEMKELILEACRVNGLRDAYIRPIVTRGEGDLGLDPRKCKDPTVLVIAKEFPTLYGAELYETGLRVATSSYRRNSPQSLSPNIKSMNYLNNIVAKIEANQRGMDEGLFLDLQGFVSEATADNFFLVRDGAVVTPPAYNSLVGITRGAVMDVARDLGLEVREEPITLFDVYGADECFITGTAAEVAPVVEVDGRQVGDGTPGPITRRLMDGFKHLTRSTGTPVYEGGKEQRVQA